MLIDALIVLWAAAWSATVLAVALVPSIGLLGPYLPSRAVGRLRADELGRLDEGPFEALLATHRRTLADSALRRHRLGRRT